MQGNPRQDRKQRLLGVVVDGALQRKSAQRAFNAQKNRRHRLGLEIHAAQNLGRRGLSGDLGAAAPVDVNGLDGFEADNDSAINRRAGLFKNACDPKRLILMFCEGCKPMGHDDRIPQTIA